ncbi:hypothetical protein EZS27_004125 [termite gut metagenome]|uniref:Uncharacterized protein n=1 Tax=termite gut metagenome TaxID=433724 RepID=A0A5J4ST86_9ZZZZ
MYLYEVSLVVRENKDRLFRDKKKMFLRCDTSFIILHKVNKVYVGS